MNAAAIRTFPVESGYSGVEEARAQPAGLGRRMPIVAFDEGETTIPTVLGFSPRTRPEPALVETAYRIGAARGRALGAMLRSLAEDVPVDGD